MTQQSPEPARTCKLDWRRLFRDYVLAPKKEDPFEAEEVISTENLAADIAQTHRSLTNPDMRLPLRADMPPVISFLQTGLFLQMLERELAKCGDTLASAGTITVAYPQKDPRLFPGHRNKGRSSGSAFIATMRDALAARGVSVDWQRADAICETRHLDRSGNQSSLHALTSRQSFGLCAEAQKTPLDFLEMSAVDGGARPYVVVVDWCMEQGTTLAELISYIEHNGGHVLLATVEGSDGSQSLVPLPARAGGTVALAPEFAAAATAGLLPKIGRALSRAAQREGIVLTTHAALTQVEARLNASGRSLKTLTSGEAARLESTLARRKLGYTELLGASPVCAQGHTPITRARGGCQEL